jgi:hypothetical protein
LPRDFIRCFSKCCTELPSVAQSVILHALLGGTTCRDLVHKLGRSPPVDSNELFDIATSFASGEEAVGAIFDGKKGKRVDEKGLPLYRLWKKHECFSWTVEAQEALDKLKATLARAPILTPPQDGEPLYLYVAATTQVVSAANVVERTEEGHALPVQ